MLVLSPTRELALQLQDEVNKFNYRGIRCICVYGGASRKEQINLVTKGFLKNHSLIFSRPAEYFLHTFFTHPVSEVEKWGNLAIKLRALSGKNEYAKEFSYKKS